MRRQMLRPKRQLEWSRQSVAIAATGALTSLNLVTPLESAMGRTLGDFTVTRIILSLWMRGTAIIQGEFSAGIVCDDRASPLLDPLTANDMQLADWMWVEAFALAGQLLESSAGGFTLQAPFVNFRLDLGSQRKCDLRKAPFLKIRNRAGSPTDVAVSVNTLVKLA